MKLATLLLTLLPLYPMAQPAVPALIPEPVSVAFYPGEFTITPQTLFVVHGTVGSPELPPLFVKTLSDNLGFDPATADWSQNLVQTVLFELNPKKEDVLGSEGYRLEVNPNGILLRANDWPGLFYGLQTLVQLMPLQKGESQTSGVITPVRIPAVSILDYPRFPWRGLMLDVSRHFFTVDQVKAYIDEMVKYKFNRFHWHLSDDQGWRIEIKSLPRLTEIGAWRVPRTGLWWTFRPPQPGEKATEGGFYTQDQIRDIVRYAAERYVTILPEIDVPGHSLALIASYPELSSTGKQYPVNPGSKFYTLEDNSLCPGKEVVFETLDKIFTEIAALFPGQYIHIGGDECYKGFWKDSPECQALMKKENIKDLNELQSYFVKRLEKILLSKGKKMIGWDEILEGGLAPEATVMSWRGMDGGIQAAKMGHHVIMTPTSNCYFDLYQGDPDFEPATYSMLRLSDVYRFEPVPDGIKQELVLGGQGNLWSESVATLRHAEYMTWPRGMAMAEVLWSPVSVRNWDDFTRRMEAHFDRLDRDGIKYAQSAFDPIIKMIDENGTKRISMSTEIDGLEIRYSFDESFPDAWYPLYTHPLDIPEGASRIRAVAAREGRIVSRPINFELKELEERMKK